MEIRGRWGWVILVVLGISLSANFFMLGFFTQRARMGFFGPPSPIVAVMRDFPPDIRRNIGEQLWLRRGEFRQTFETLRLKRRAIVDLMRAPKIDVERLRTLLRETRGLTDDALDKAQDALIEAVEKLSPEERARIGEPQR